MAAFLRPGAASSEGEECGRCAKKSHQSAIAHTDGVQEEARAAKGGALDEC